MNRSSYNRPKDVREKFQYNKGLKEQAIEPTFLRDSGYKLSSDPDIDVGLGQSYTPPHSNTSGFLKEHFTNHWPTWLFGLLLIIAGGFIWDAKTDIKVLFEKISNTNDNVKSQKADIDRINKELNDQNLKLQENKIRIENLEKFNDKNKNGGN